MSEGAEIVEFLRRIFERRSVHPPASITGILGSSRKDGNTRVLTDAVLRHLNDAQLIDLSDLTIAPYDYDHADTRDDFLPLAEMMAQSTAIIFASPVYWYSMSAQMKVFFDRLTDLTKTHKALGRSLAGKTAYLVATGADKTPAPSFEAPFAETAGYFGMHWGGMLHQSFNSDRRMTSQMDEHAAAFAEKIKTSLQAADTMSKQGPLAA